eukprot:SAG11_NODE_2947_length_2820_cov_1.771408_1_plen_58_part_00
MHACVAGKNISPAKSIDELREYFEKFGGIETIKYTMKLPIREKYLASFVLRPQRSKA